MTFSGIPADAFAYLRELAAEQNKPWFEANRARYESHLREPCAALVIALAEACAARGLPLQGDPKRSMFRMHRDVRFSKDKSPYKTHAGLVLMRPGGSKTPNGVLYVHVQPQGSFAAAGFYAPEPKLLEALRRAMQRRPEAWAKIERDLAAEGIGFEDGDPLTRMPRGFEDATASDLALALRRRSHLVTAKLTQKELSQTGVVDRIVGFAASALPFLRFGWTAIDEGSPEASRIARFLPQRGA